jgi:hypothetical protein
MAANDKDDDQTRSFTVLSVGVIHFNEESVWHLLLGITRISTPLP